MGDFLIDVRYGLRTLRNAPGFTTVAVLVLAVGIGATIAIFSLVSSVLLRPLPYPEPDELVRVFDQQQKSTTPMSYPEYLAWKQQTEVFQHLAATFNGTVAMTGAGEPQQLRTLRASASLLPMLGISPLLGRNFLPEEEPREGPPVVMLSHSFWTDRFRGDQSILGQTLTLDDRIYTIVGVLPPDFRLGNRPHVLIPLRLNEQMAPRDLHFMQVIARLKPGLELEQARAALTALVPRVQKLTAGTDSVFIAPLQATMVRDSRPILLVLLGAVAFVLLIACANMANLLLARATGRQKEIAIRVALGAGRMRLIRQLLTESTLLSALGGVLGLLLAVLSIKSLVSLLDNRVLPPNIPVEIDSRVLLFAVFVSLASGILFGLVPALQVATGSLSERLKEGGRDSHSAGASQTLRHALIIGEMALSLVLLAAAGLLMRSFINMLYVDKGFNPDHLLTMAINPSPGRYTDPIAEINYTEQIVANVGTLPGVKSNALVTTLPLSGNNTNGDFQIEGRTFPPEDPPNTSKQFISADYFRTMQIPLIKGRFFGSTDTTTAPKVVIIDETFARTYFPSEDPIGKRIDLGWGDPGWSEIVGVVGNTKLDAVDARQGPTFYALISQKPDIIKFLGFTLVVRTDLDPASIFPAVSDRIRRLDKNQPISEVRTMHEVISTSVAPHRAPAWLLGAFSAVALFLAAIGIYGVLSYYVVQRRQEIGVRMALGAQRSDVLSLVLHQGGRLILAGIVLGLFGAFAASRLLAGFLFGVKPTDLPTFVVVSLLLAALALIACYVPARRATRVDPMVALRYE